MEYAAGTSLVVITITSAVALLVRTGTGVQPDWGLVLAAHRGLGRGRRPRRPPRRPRRHPAALGRLHRPRARGGDRHRRPGPARSRLRHPNPAKGMLMSTSTTGRHARPAIDPGVGYRPGPLGRLGVAVTRHARLTTVVWLLVIVGLGAFAPRVEAELSGAGWQADGSESVAVRELAQDHFGGNASSAIQVVVHSTDGPVTEGAGKQVLAEATTILEARPADRRGRPAAARRHAEPGRLHRGDPGRCRRRHQRDGPGRRRPQGAAAGPLHEHRAGQPDRRLAAVVGLQRGQPRRDAEVGDVLLAGDAGHPGAGVRRPRGRRAAADPDAGRPGRLGRLAGADQPGRPGLDLGDELRDDVRPRPRHRLRAVPRGPLPGGADGRPRVPTPGDRRDHGHRRQGRAALRGHRADLAVRGDAGARRRRSGRWPAASCSRSSSCWPPP